ncbi:DUF3231 family protein [Ammoniphilus sp. YIM 78166]|uniref:DUF3231 family protein n=1 Tax=Ammoniphilus sp. YIM 78166 TaxID=1644106 RepID=UPI00106FF833|nr:DUF3231 family protein [Ammoniphilus sp. YIM 78166]
MSEKTTRLSSAELGGLWKHYIQDTMSVCFLRYFLHHLQDEQLKVVIQKALSYSETHLVQIREIFHFENIPIPVGFTTEDVDLSAPPLFHDPYALSFVYIMSRMEMISYSFTTSSVGREDVRTLFTQCLQHANELYNDSTSLMISIGIYDRAPMINYPRKIEFVQNESLLLGYIGKKRPLNALELSEIFLNIERNYFATVFCLGLLQVVKDKEIKKYIQRGKDICDKQVKLFNELLMNEDLLGTVPITMELTDSTTSPFSDKLIVGLFHALNSLDITLIGHALSMSMRADLAAHYSKLILEIILYGKEGFNIMVDRKWLEQPPQATDRRDLIRSQ